jgi:hypothetical protein
MTIENSLLEIIKEEQESIVTLLLLKEKVSLIDKNGKMCLSNVKPLNFSKINTKDVENYLSLWNENFRGNKLEIKVMMERLVNTSNISVNDILNATKEWLEDKVAPYHGTAKNFLFMNSNNVETSRCLDTLELMKTNKKKETEDFRNQSL